MAVIESLEKARNILQSSVLLLSKDKSLIKVLIAVGSAGNKSMILDDIKELTGLSSEEVNKSAGFLEKLGYLTNMMDDVPSRSPHMICKVTKEGQKILEVLNTI